LSRRNSKSSLNNSFKSNRSCNSDNETSLNKSDEPIKSKTLGSFNFNTLKDKNINKGNKNNNIKSEEGGFTAISNYLDNIESDFYKIKKSDVDNERYKDKNTFHFNSLLKEFK